MFLHGELQGRVIRWRALLLAAVAIVFLGTIALTVDYWERGGNSFAAKSQMSQYYGLLNTDPLEDYSDVLAIGHNSGESSYTVNRALSYGADVIEIDVSQRNGQLIAAHDSPTGWRSRIYRGLTLEQAWRIASKSDIVQLDLKESSPAFQGKVFTFLEKHEGERQVIVTTRSTEVLTNLSERFPDVLRFLSIGDRFALELLLQDTELANRLDGVTVRHTLLDDTVVQRLDESSLVVIAWTVNDLERVNALIRMGVNGITTDNLAILELIHNLGRTSDTT